MSGKRQKNQMELAFTAGSRGEAPRAAEEGTEPSVAEREAEGPASTRHLMEEVCQRENLKKALKRVKANKGSPGVDSMTVQQLPEFLREHWPAIREQLLSGTYKPQPVERVEIPKRDGGVRKLGIPTVLDRFIQQAVMQVLQDRWDPTFSQHSYGFRPGRSAHQAVVQAQRYIAEGHEWVVDIDLEKFFDRVNHDMLMGRIAKRVEDKRLLRLVRAFLNAGVMDEGLVSRTQEGTPQGGPLSPLLSNLVLDDLDRELEKRGHRFVRYADDCNIYVRSPRAGQRLMDSIRGFIAKKLKLKVNEKKSAVARPRERKFLGFSFMGNREAKIRIAPETLERFKKRIRRMTRKTRGVSIEQMVEDLAPYVRGWDGYFGLCQTPTVMRDLNSWMRRRLRCVVWRQWRHGRKRVNEMRKRGVRKEVAVKTAGSSHGAWFLSHTLGVRLALPNSYFSSLGMPTLMSRGRLI